MAAEARQPRMCVYCGSRQATTIDHIPPRAIFPKPRPDDLVTVPSCFPCNNQSSKDDEEFRTFISIRAGNTDRPARELWERGLIPTLRHNERLRSSILDRAKDFQLTTPAGIVLGNVKGLPLRAAPHRRVLERIVRGLYFHHFGEPLHSSTSVEANPVTGFDGEHLAILQTLPLARIGGGRFAYRFARAHDSPQDSIWAMAFYGRHLVWAHSESCSVP